MLVTWSMRQTLPVVQLQATRRSVRTCTELTRPPIFAAVGVESLDRFADQRPPPTRSWF